MVLSLEQCNLAIHEIDNEFYKFNRMLRHSNIKLVELEGIDHKILQTIKHFQETIDVLEIERSSESCYSYSGRKMSIISALSGVTVLFTTGALACAAFGSTEAVQWGGFIFGTLTAGLTGGTTWYTSKISVDAERKSKLIELTQEGLKNAALFKRFIKSFKQLKEDEHKALKHDFKKMKRKSKLLESREVRESNSSSIYPLVSSNGSDSENQSKQRDERVNSTISESPETPSFSDIIPIKDSQKNPETDQERSQEFVKSNQTQSLDDKITECLSECEALPKKYKKKGDLYFQLLSTCIQYLPDQDPIKLEFQALANFHNETGGSSKGLNDQNDLKLDKSPPELAQDQIAQNPSLKKFAIREVDIAKRYDRLTKTVAARFKIRRPITHLDAPNGLRVTSRGTMRVDRKSSSEAESKGEVCIKINEVKEPEKILIEGNQVLTV